MEECDTPYNPANEEEGIPKRISLRKIQDQGDRPEDTVAYSSMCEEEGECKELNWGIDSQPKTSSLTQAELMKKREDVLANNPSMVDDIGDREKSDVEYSIFREDEKKPGYY